MPEARMAWNGAAFDGLAQVRELPVQGMISLRGDLASAPVQNAATEVTGAAMPGPRGVEGAGDSAIAWMSPDELLILLPHGTVQDALARMDAVLAGEHALALDMSDARAVFEVEGPAAREVLAKLCPVDLDPAVFGPGEMRRTRAAQIAVAFWQSGPHAFRLICFRSVAGYLFDLLKGAAHPAARVGVFDPSA
ncbi:sarcosine oxidase subunit gamma [Actibacterium sp. 188UL27-1]|uniref:sarcosine oxidase subunit gamma n=1 Tax=Actibacterium sp. 188UL27-1 TaxID=2786961 RepID=UPI00195E57D1|nr:sarcosine oxidase subunit gamma family protein [Actibacterium sp. 188UL27-1]MBM7066587.1 sarcosine oxidase subunit gamma [Actibacterium sp. 188UL27-1]